MQLKIMTNYGCFYISAVLKYMDESVNKYPSPIRFCAGPFRLGIALKDADEIEVNISAQMNVYHIKILY